MEKEKKEKQPGLVDYILQSPDSKRKYAQSILLALIGVLFSLFPYFLMGNMVRQLMAGEERFSVFLQEGLLMAACWIFRVVFHTLSTNLSHRTTFQLIGDIKIALCDKLAKLPLGTVLDIPSGALKNMIVERTDSIEPTLAHVVPEFTANMTAPVLMFVYLFFIDWRMALLSLATLPIGVVCMAWMTKDYQIPFQKTQTTTKALNDAAVEYINGIEVIKVFGETEKSYQKFSDAAKANANSFIDWMHATAIPFSLGMVLTPASLLAVLPIGALFVIHGSLAFTDYVVVLVLACGLIAPLLTAMSYTDDIQKTSSIFGEIDSILQLSELVRPQNSKALPGDHTIALEDVHFGYREKEVLHGINLVIPSGSSLALVGPSGSGKSTIARLIASLWDVDKGSIRIGGVDIRDMSLADYNRQIACVFQESFLFNTTIRENIRMGNPAADDAEVEEIAKKSGCYEFISKLEQGFDTVVGFGGDHLSGGEKQRISIARAMLKNAPILILDEATAYTDPESEALIQDSVSQLAAGKTLIVIAHRLSTITAMDQIAVVENGDIVAKGTHEELLQTCSLYHRMWEAHISSKDSDSANGYREESVMKKADVSNMEKGDQI